MSRAPFSFRFRILSGRMGKKPWFSFEFSWGHSIAQVGDLYRENWSEFDIGFHSWWVRPGYSNHFYDGPHPCFSLGFIIISWEPWGAGEWLEPEHIDGKRAEAKTEGSKPR